MRNNLLTILGFIVLSGFLSSCQSVKPYQRMYLNDSSMKLGKNRVAGFENSAHAIREGASSGQTKSTGGCGCN
jgi:hypothetical protein